MEGKEQDLHLMNAIFAALQAHQLSPINDAVKLHDRSIQVAFKDGRVVTLVLYGPRRGASHA